MAYHSEFWVTVASVAPVVGLAHAVLVGRYTSRADDLADHRRTEVDRAKAFLAEKEAGRDSVRAHLRMREGELVEFGTPKPPSSPPGPPDPVAAWLDNSAIAELRSFVKKLREQLDEAELQVSAAEGSLASVLAMRRPARRVALLSMFLDGVALASWLLCAFALLAGLLSLANESNWVPQWLGVVADVIPMAAVVVAPTFDRTMRVRLKVLGVS